RQVAIERAAPVVQAREEALLRGALEREAYAARPGHLGPPRDAPPLSEAPGVALEARGRDAERRHRRLQLAPGDRGPVPKRNASGAGSPPGIRRSSTRYASRAWFS